MNIEIISVCVITYFSEDTIDDTLNSILNQNYGPENIELIIGDDGSKDNTVRKIESWLDDHKHKFSHVLFIKHPVNIGVSANINSVWKAASYKWVKAIAGDDILCANALTGLVDFKNKNQDAKCIFTLMQEFYCSDNGSISYGKILPQENNINFFSLDRESQFNYYLFRSFNIGPTSFFDKSALLEIGFANEKYTLWDDYPTYIRLLEKNKFYLHDEITVKYRKADSITYSNSKFVNLNFLKQEKDFYQSYSYKKAFGVNRLYAFDKRVEIFLYAFVAKINKNNLTLISKMMFSFLSLILRPVHFKNKFRCIFKNR